MEYNDPREREVLVDIENGGISSAEDINKDAGNKKGKRLLNKLTSGVLRHDTLASGESVDNLDGNLGKTGGESQENVELWIDKNLGRQSEERIPLLEKEHAKEKPRLTNSKKASKPPRPPKGPLLDASDLKLVKEISELVMKKRARNKSIKALQKARAAKSASSPPPSNNSTLCGMAITVVFFFVIIFQGFSWRDSSTSILQGSPEPATRINGLISIQVFNNLLSSHGIAPSSESPSSGEQLFGSDSHPQDRIG